MPNPKRPWKAAGGRNSWYPFYPGFSVEFASWVLDGLTHPGSRLLDPWNGSGATTALAAQRGLSATGIDLNPAMVVIARAKLLDPLEVESIRPLRKQVLSLAGRREMQFVAADEPLSEIFAYEGPSAVRAIERAIRQLLVDDVTSVHCDAPDATKMSPMAAFFYVALFRVCRELLHKSRTTNPVWTRLRVPGQHRPRPTMTRVLEAFVTEVDSMLASEAEGRPTPRGNSPSVSVGVGNSTNLPVPDRSVDLILSSPPYCTRVDYAVAMLPELSVLGLKRDTSFKELRKQLTGTTTVPSQCDPIDPSWGQTCGDFLQAVSSHGSKASAGYYLKGHARYFRDLAVSIGELRRVATKGSVALLVVQDSHYKEIHNDLPAIAIEMAEHAGFSHAISRHFPLTRLIAASNPNVRKYRAGGISATESVIVLEG